MFRTQIHAVALLLAFFTAPTAAAQQGGSDDPLFTGGDAVWAAGFAAGTLLLVPLDVEIAEAARHSAAQQNRWLSASAGGLRLLGVPGVLAVSGGMYAIGRVADRPALADVGLHSGTALAVAGAVTMGAKLLAGRARPYESPADPLSFGFGRGFRDDAFQSLPSGHATLAFAAAAAITAEVGHHWPDARLLTGTALFGSATLVSLSRLYHDVHWASDTMLGAGVGTLSGWKVVRYLHAHPNNQLDRWMLGVTIAPSPAGRQARLWLAPLP